MTTRRDLISAGLVATAMAASGVPVQAQTVKKTFLLVHGSWAGGWVWRPLADLLQSRGHKVFTPTLTGLGERSHLLNDNINLGTHITDVVNVIKWERLTDFVLVGHSYGGNVISGVAEKAEPAIRAIVFLDAFVPEGGPLQLIPQMVDQIKQARDKGENTIKPPPVSFFQNDDSHNGWLDALLMPQPIGTYTDSLALTGARERISKKIFVRTTRYRVPIFEAAYTKVRSNPTWISFELDCGHHPMLNMPERTTEILEAA